MVVLDKVYVCKSVGANEVFLETEKGENLLIVQENGILSVTLGLKYHISVEANIRSGNHKILIQKVD